MYAFRLLAAILLYTVGTASLAIAESITVNTIDDVEATDGFCSLREAILAANDDIAHNECAAGEGTDHIDFSLVAGAVIELVDHLPPITESLAIHGPGADELSLDGAQLYRAITVEAPSTGIELAVQHLTLLNGRTRLGDFGGGGAMIDGGASALFERVHFFGNRSENAGGGLMVGSGSNEVSHVTLIECWFEGNRSEGPAGGGGLSTTGTGRVVDIVRSAFVDNHSEAPDSVGGAMATSRGFVTIDASTISGNSAMSNGGGIYTSTAPQGGSSLLIRDTTITQNTAGAGLTTGSGGGLYLVPGTDNPLTVSLENSVVAENFYLALNNEPDLFCGSLIASFSATGSNLIGANDGCDTHFPVGFPNANGDSAGTVAAALAPWLENLADNGGPTPTHQPLLSPLSPLVDRGTCSGIQADQRFYGTPGSSLRIRDLPAVTNGTGSDGCDIGAFEVLGDPMRPNRIFDDDFEHGQTLRWSDERP